MPDQDYVDALNERISNLKETVEEQQRQIDWLASMLRETAQQHQALAEFARDKVALIVKALEVRS